jgi:hypothetical protein
MANMVQNNMADDATQLRISILEKQLQQQTQTSKEILNHLKIKKRSENSHHNHPIPSLNQQSLSFAPKNIVDLTSHSPEKYNTSFKNLQRNKKQKLHWDNDIAQIHQYNQFNPPNQMFPNSITLNPFLRTNRQTPNISHIPFQPLLPPNQPIMPPNPFMLSTQLNTKTYQGSTFCDGRSRGGRRGSNQIASSY